MKPVGESERLKRSPDMPIEQLNLQLSFEHPLTFLSLEGYGRVLEQRQTRSGIYVWAVQTRLAQVVQYVGETRRSLGERFTEHWMQLLSGAYRIYDPDELDGDVSKLVWPGRYRQSSDDWYERFASRLPELAPALNRYLSAIRIHFAPLVGDDRARKRLEAALADHFQGLPGPVGQFFDTGVNYQRSRSDELLITVECSWATELVGSPSKLECAHWS
jgi:hypothetical protein